MADHAAITQVFQKMDSDSILERVDTGFYIDGRNFKIYTGRDGNAQHLHPQLQRVDHTK